MTGISFDPQTGPVLLSELIGRVLAGAECAVLMGANVASEVGEGQLCEATVGVRHGEGRDWLALFHQPTFRCRVVAGEMATIEMLGALKVRWPPRLASGLPFSLAARTLWRWRRALPTDSDAGATPRRR